MYGTAVVLYTDMYCTTVALSYRESEMCMVQQWHSVLQISIVQLWYCSCHTDMYSTTVVLSCFFLDTYLTPIRFSGIPHDE